MEQKVAFITGSSSGIGRATALRFARAGYAVAVSYVHDEEAGKKVTLECLEEGASGVLLVNLDVRNYESVEKAVEGIVGKFGHIDVLINNSGIALKNPLVEQSEEIIHNQIAINLVGSIVVTRACLPNLTSSIIFVGSKTALRGKGKMSVYSATKFGIRGFAESIALEYPHFCVAVVNPGIVATRMGSPDSESPDVVADVIFRTATGQYRVRSGGCVNVWEYQHGRMARYGILALLLTKRMIKKMLRITP